MFNSIFGGYGPTVSNSGGAPTGPAGGALTGTYPNPGLDSLSYPALLSTKPLESEGFLEFIGCVTPEMFGAVGNGSTDDSAAIQAAFDTLVPVFFNKKNYKVASAITLASNSRAFGSGKGTIISTTSNISIFSIVGNYCSVENITFQGNYPTVNALQNGISIAGNGTTFTDYRISNQITNCQFINLGGAGLYSYWMIGLSSGGQHQGGFYAVNCYAYNCNTGFYNDTRAEYNTYSNCSASVCLIGYRSKGGNNNWIGGNITDNTTGISLEADSNDGHCSIVGTKINHNTAALNCVSGNKNFTFTSCQIYLGTILFNGARDYRFIGCEFNGNPTITHTNASVEYRSCLFTSGLTTSNFLVTAGNKPIGSSNTFLVANTSLYLQNRGSATLVGGTILVTNASVNALSDIILTVNVIGGIQGILSVTRVNNTSFTINSSNAADTSTIGWVLNQNL